MYDSWVPSAMCGLSVEANAPNVPFGNCKCSLFTGFKHELLAYLGPTVSQSFQSLQTDLTQQVTLVFTALHANL